MQDRHVRFVALTGAVWAVLAVIGIVTAGGETPEGSASAAKVVTYYSLHSSEIKTSSVFFVLAFLFLLLFCGVLRAFLRRNPANEPLATLMLAAAAVVTVTAGMLSGVELGLAKNIHHLGPQAAQAVNLVSNEGFLPLLIGGFVFSICNGLAILRGSLLPRWLGWVAIVMAIVFLIPPIVIVGFFLLVAWSLVVSIFMFMRFSGEVQPAPPVLGA